jgi:hypothetical protein
MLHFLYCLMSFGSIIFPVFSLLHFIFSYQHCHVYASLHNLGLHPWKQTFIILFSPFLRKGRNRSLNRIFLHIILFYFLSFSGLISFINFHIYFFLQIIELESNFEPTCKHVFCEFVQLSFTNVIDAFDSNIVA